MAYQLMGGNQPQAQYQLPGAPKTGTPPPAPPPAPKPTGTSQTYPALEYDTSPTLPPTMPQPKSAGAPLPVQPASPTQMAANTYDYMLMNDGQMPTSSQQLQQSSVAQGQGMRVMDWQQNPGQIPQLPAGVNPARPGEIEQITVERPFFTDPNNPAGSRNYGDQRISIPVLGRTASGMKYYPSFAGFDQNGEILWDHTRPNLGTPSIDWQSSLDPSVQDEMDRNSGADLQPGWTPNSWRPPAGSAPPPQVQSSAEMSWGAAPGTSSNPTGGQQQADAGASSIPQGVRDALAGNPALLERLERMDPQERERLGYNDPSVYTDVDRNPNDYTMNHYGSGTGGLPGPGGSGGPPSSGPPPGTYNQRDNPFPGTPFFGIDSSVLPGLMSNADSYTDYNNLVMTYLNMMGDRSLREFGGENGIGGNSVRNDGTWSAPDFLRNSASRYGEADTDAFTRGITDGELVEGRLGNLLREDNELNQIAKEDALAEAASRGMLGSGVAAGAALRASRQAMLPIAQQDAQAEFNVRQGNQDAVNRDRLSDQQNRTGLLSQEIGASANLLDSATDRRWRSNEANTERGYELMRDDLNFRRGTLDREDQQQFQWGSQEQQNQYNAWQSGLDREFQLTRDRIQNEFQGTEAERNRVQDRINTFYQATFGREGAMSNILASIYNNPNMTPEQQRAAAENAQAIMGALWASFNATLGQGVPDIFRDPYAIEQPPPGEQPPPTEPPPANP